MYVVRGSFVFYIWPDLYVVWCHYSFDQDRANAELIVGFNVRLEIGLDITISSCMCEFLQTLSPELPWISSFTT